MQSRFIELLNQYTIKETAIPVLQAKLESIYYQQRKGDAEMTDTLQQQLTAVNKKIENIEYSYYVDRDMTREIFEKFLYKFNAERAEIKTQITG